MGQKTHPVGFRLALTRNWLSRWYASKKDFPGLLYEDQIIRQKLMEKLKQASVPRIFIERASNRVRVKIFTARPGIVIGRKGAEIDKLREDLQKRLNRPVSVDIQEIKKPEVDAQLVAEGVAQQLERRIAFRRAMRKAEEAAIRFGAKGFKIKVSGRLNGAEIARTEDYLSGQMPLQTIRAGVDYGFAEARTTYGIIGIKVWVNLGDQVAETVKR